MEGLLIAERLRVLSRLLPAERRGWSFPDDRTAVLPLAGAVSLWLSSRPPTPHLELRPGAPAAAAPRTPFQEQLAARATGVLVAAVQPALDRVARFEFAASTGFVPEPATTLVAELTGRNANLVLLGEAGTILGVERLILAGRNRYRELRPGVAYLPPPPYDKLDPRRASREDLSDALRGRRLEEVRDVVDGIGPRLLAALRSLAEVDDDLPLAGERLAAVVTALERLASQPSASLTASGAAPEAGDTGGERRVGELRSAVGAALSRRQKLALRRVNDAEQGQAGTADARRLRAEADLLLANVGSFAPRGTKATLRGYDGSDVELEIDPRLDAAGNARVRYERAKRREGRAARAAAQLPQLRQELAAVERANAELATAGESRLRELAKEWGEAEAAGGARQGASGKASGKAGATAGGERFGVRFVDPRGYEVFVGRSAKENDAVTFKLARSLDLWLHVQGYRGAHVVVRSHGRELPFDTVLFAARLAAGFSQARDSDNVPVDYTLRKHVWRQKGGLAGAANFAHHKTVYVTPARDDAAASAERSGA